MLALRKNPRLAKGRYGRKRLDMKFGIFDYIDDRGETLQKTNEERLVLLQAAEEAGFTGYHLTEHHSTPLSMTPSPSVYLAAAARETRCIRLGTLLYLLPLYHPVRLLEELCMLDHLSGGRHDIGVGRGISPMESGAKRCFDSLAWLWVERGTFPPISISADYDQSKAAGTLVVGSPDTVRRILTAQAE